MRRCIDCILVVLPFIFVSFMEIPERICFSAHIPATSSSVKDSTEVSRDTFESGLQDLYDAIDARKYELKYDAFRYALIGYKALRRENRLNDKELISIIDFTRSSCEKRFYTIDLCRKKILFNTYVSHGKNSGGDTSSEFSDECESHRSSIGFYVTGATYTGNNGFSMRLYGYEEGYNANLYNRAVVVHTADYVSEDFIRRHGRLGRSYGCPVLPRHIYKDIIDKIKDGTVIFAYYNDKTYLQNSKYTRIAPDLITSL